MAAAAAVPNTSGGESSTPPEVTPEAPDTRLAELAKAEARAAAKAKAVDETAEDMPQDGRVDETAEDAPVYDERGNVRPRGTAGAKPMTFEQRADLARKQDRGGQVPPDGEPAARKATTRASAPRRRRS